MTRSEALTILLGWQSRHPKEDLVIGGEELTDIGRRALERLEHYPSGAVRKAVADCEIEDKFSRLSGVFARIGRPSTANIVSDIPEEWAKFGHGRVVAFAGDDYGIVDLSEPPGVIWTLEYDDRPYGGPRRPEWRIMSPEKYHAGMAMPVSQERADELKMVWWQMETAVKDTPAGKAQHCKFETNGPWPFYCPPTPPRPYKDLVAEFRRMCMGKDIAKKGGAPRSIGEVFGKAKTPDLAQAMSPGHVKAGEHIGWEPPEDDPIGF